MQSQEARLAREEIDALATRIAETSAQIDAATHQLLTQIRTFDRAEGWGVQGALSCAHWLNWRVGIALGAAREKVRVARRLGELPLIDDALRTATVSYSKVRAMTRVATPENEEVLLELAHNATAAQLEKICRLYRPVQQADALDAEAARARRCVTQRRTDDGMVQITATLHPDEAARLLKAIDVSAETSGTTDRADGLVALADAALDDPAHSGKPAVEATVRVEVDAATLVGRLEDSTGVSAETSRRLLCDAGVVPMAEDRGGNPLSVGRKRRTVSAALRRALKTRDRGCCFPGCTHERWVDAHHIEHWVDGGETSLENTLLLCRRHHRIVHEDGFSISRSDNGELHFLDPEGRVVPEGGEADLRRLISGQRLWVAVAKRAAEVNATSNRPRGDGTGLDYSMAIDALLEAEHASHPRGAAPTTR